MNESRLVGLIIRGADPWYILGKIWPIFGPFINSDYLISIFFLYEIFRKISQSLCNLNSVLERHKFNKTTVCITKYTQITEREKHTWLYHITGYFSFWVLTYNAWSFIEYSFVYEERRWVPKRKQPQIWQSIRIDQCLVLLQMYCSNRANKDIISRMKNE